MLGLKLYEYMKTEERATLMLMKWKGSTVRAVARALNRSSSSISGELKKHRTEGQFYEAGAAEDRASEKRLQRRRMPKLGVHKVLFVVVEHFPVEGSSPEEIAGTLRNRYADDSEKRVSHETIYNALYVMPRGASYVTPWLPEASQTRLAPQGAG
jgi:IS30 family transposase